MNKAEKKASATAYTMLKLLIHR